MSSRLSTLWRQHPLAFATEIVLLLAFAVSLIVTACLPSVQSPLSLIPHVLGTCALVILYARYRLQERPAMYWSHFDFLVVSLFLIMLVNVYYSEIRSISWKTAAFYWNCLAAFFLGRMLFYHRLKAFVATLIVALGIAWVVCGMVSGQQEQMATEALASAAAATLPADADRFNEIADMAVETQERLANVRHTFALFMVFWVLAFPFFFLKRPSSFSFLVFLVLIGVLYAFYFTARHAYMFGSAGLSEKIEQRHARVEGLRTAWRILENYPLTGSGLGTFLDLFEAYRLSPHVPFTTNGFNAFVFSAVETGIPVVALLIYFLIRIPLHTIRRFSLYPNRQLRFSIVTFLLFFLLCMVQSFHDANFFSTYAWYPFWAVIGTLISLVVIRDPVRIFDAVQPLGRAHDNEHLQRRAYNTSTTGFGRTPFAKLPRPRWNFTLQKRLRMVLTTVFIAAAAFAITVLQILPYWSSNVAQLRQGETEESTQYAERLQTALRIFPLDSSYSSRLAEHYYARVNDPLDIYEYGDRIETAYLQAIRLNPYREGLYEGLYYLYHDTNRPEEGLEILKRGVRNNPNAWVLRMLLVRELEGFGNLALATYHVKQVLHRAQPDQVQLYVRLAELYDLQGKQANAIQYYKYSMQVVPRTPEVEARLTRLRQRLKIEG